MKILSSLGSLVAIVSLLAGCAHGGEGGVGGAGGQGLGTPAKCTPGERSCKDGIASFCRPDGSLDQYACDANQALDCQPSGCVGQCAHETLGPSYQGCDYYPTVTLNPVWSGFDFAVAVANTEPTPTHVLVTRGDATIDARTIAANAVAIITLPWVPELKGTDFTKTGSIADASGPTRLVAGGAYHLQTTQPVTVYQYNSLEYSRPKAAAGCPPASDGSGGCFSFSNDSSLLLPASALGRAYTAMSWPSLPVNPGVDGAGFVSITATNDNTLVRFASTAEITPGAGLDASGAGHAMLQAGDVLEIVAAPGKLGGTLGAPLLFGPDLSGSRVFASKPVSVISGHRCGFVPTSSSGYCDHLEEGMFPTATLGKEYVVAAPSGTAANVIWPYVLRISAALAPTTVRFDPPVHPDVILAPGEPPFQIDGLRKDVHVVADQPILVAQYLQGSTSEPTASGKVPDEGDPALSLAVPVEQYRNTTVFATSTTYDKNFIAVIAPAAAVVKVDGAAVPASAFSSVGTSGRVVARILLAQTEVHEVSSDAAIGVVVYSYGKYTSTMNPGGLDLKRISDEPVDPPK